MSEEALSVSGDDASVSSGEDLLNMEVPFSQHSTSISPEKDQEKLSAGEEGNSPGKKRKHGEISDEDGEKARANAKKAFDIAFHECRIGHPDKLLWFERTEKRKKVINPVRAVPTDETVGLALREWNGEKECPVQYLQYSHPQIRGEICQYDIATRSGLTPYHNGGERGRWCAAKFERYSKQMRRSHRSLRAEDLKAEESYLQLVLDKSLEEGKRASELAELDEAVPQEEIPVGAGDVDGKERSVPEQEERSEEDPNGPRRSRRQSAIGLGSAQGGRESLRPGDRIAFYDPQSVAGDERGYMEMTILFINPGGSRVLVLDDPFVTLERDHLVKLVGRMRRGKLEVRRGQWRAIDEHNLKKEGDPHALRNQLQKEKERGKEIMQKAKEKGIANMKKDGVYIEDALR